MPKRITIIILALLLLLKFSGFGQSQSLKVGAELPLNYSIGLENRFSEGFAVYGQIGALLFPFNYTSLGMMETYGGNKGMTDILESNFRSGLVIGTGANYFFSKQTRKNYAGPFLQYFNMFKADISDHVINDYFDVDLNSYASGAIPRNISKEPLTLTTNFMQVGFLYGRRIFFYKKTNIELHTEFGISKTFYSNSRIDSDFRIFSVALKDEVNNSIDEYYKKYALLTTLNIYFIYKFNYQKF
ncbi:MAG: hypothetical protein K9J13_06550 [Saprospiraceae bacterium]|nr:hypothetical protein [Saprospiraceae bacterium]